MILETAPLPPLDVLTAPFVHAAEHQVRPCEMTSQLTAGMVTPP